MKKYFLTGVTGFLGQELLRLLSAEGADVVCLTRPGKEGDARERLNASLVGSDIDPAKVGVAGGDLSAPHFGLDPAEYDRLAATVTNIIHCAADVRFNRTLEQIRRINVDGSRHILEFAADCRKHNPAFERLDYVSTAYVAGRRTGVISEDDLEHTAGFRNSYEQSKNEAEQLVRAKMAELPIAVFRPAIVLGISASGVAKPNNVIYPLLKIFARWRLSAVPANPAARLDLVPVDYVAKALLAISRGPNAVGQTFHLCAGEEGDMSLGRFIKIMAQTFHRKIIVLPPWVHLYIVRPIEKVFFRKFYLRTTGTFRAFESYIFGTPPRFSTAHTRAALEGTGIAIPDTETYVRNCLEYAVKTKFGKEPAPTI